jgi:hypothetical protein
MLTNEKTRGKNPDKTWHRFAAPPSLGLVLRVAREYLGDVPLADRAEALKCVCARFKIPYTSTVIAEALDRLEGKKP